MARSAPLPKAAKSYPQPSQQLYHFREHVGGRQALRADTDLIISRLFLSRGLNENSAPGRGCECDLQACKRDTCTHFNHGDADGVRGRRFQCMSHPGSDFLCIISKGRQCSAQCAVVAPFPSECVEPRQRVQQSSVTRRGGIIEPLLATRNRCLGVFRSKKTTDRVRVLKIAQRTIDTISPAARTCKWFTGTSVDGF